MVPVPDGGDDPRDASPLVVLRAATATRHAHLDAGLGLDDPKLTRAEYDRLLLRLLGVVEPLEEAVSAAPVPLPDWPARRRAHLLRADTGTGAATAPRCGDLPDLTDPDRALGCVYVLEGSTLGGRHVAAAVRRTLGPEAPTRWFRADGDDVPARWQRFRRALADRAGAGGDVDAMAAGACDTFDTLLGWLIPTAAAP